MNIVVAYIAVTQGILTEGYCSRFVGTWLTYDAGAKCSVLVVCNGGPLPLQTALLFDPLGAKFMPRLNDSGWDISGYQEVAAKIPCDMLVCLGESVYFHRPGWLKKMVEAWNQFGPGMYGFFSSNLVRSHMNTTAFVVDPSLLQQYPKVTSHQERYDFEHGAHCFWRAVQAQHRPTKLVTWDGVWDPFQWRLPQDILWRGSQRNCLAFCSHTDRYFAGDRKTREKWARWVDAPFK